MAKAEIASITSRRTLLGTIASVPLGAVVPAAAVAPSDSHPAWLADDIPEAVEIDADDLWERVTGEERKWPTAHYAAGFVKGAVDVFRELKAKI